MERVSVEARINDNEQAISVANPDEDMTEHENDLRIGRALLEALDAQ